MQTKTTTVTGDLVSIPARLFIGAPVLATAVIEAAVLAAAALVFPDRLGSVVTGALAAVFGIGVGSAVLRPWKAREKAAWPTVVLAGHGISMGLLLAAAVSLYSATRPDAVAFVAAVALPFPVAMIVQARLALGPALASPADRGPSALDSQ